MNEHQPTHRRTIFWSYGLLAVAMVLFILTGVILDSALASLSTAVQRWIVFWALILPAVLGALAGFLALRQKSAHPLLALGGMVLNALFALFFIALLGIAG